MTMSLRHQSEPHLRVGRHLSSSIGNMKTMLDGHVDIMNTTKTSFHRLQRLNKYVINKEADRHGAQGRNAAEASAASNRLEKPQYPKYDDLVAPVMHPKGNPRPQPLMSVSLTKQYRMPDDALFHGTKRDFANRSMRST